MTYIWREAITTSKMEKVKLDAQTAAADAKVKVLLKHNGTEPLRDAINVYYKEASKRAKAENTRTFTSTLEFIQIDICT